MACQSILNSFYSDFEWGIKTSLNNQIELFDWVRQEPILFSSSLVAVYGLTYTDKPIRNYFKTTHSKNLSSLFRFGNEYGEPVNATIISLGSYFTGLLIQNKWLKETGLLLSTSLLSTGIFQTFTKQLFGRARPEADDGIRTFKPFSGKEYYYSFPSGHSVVAFTTSFVLAKRTNYKSLKIILYAFSTVTALSRIYDDRHWFTDVATSAFISYTIVEQTFSRFKKKKKNALSLNVSLSNLTITFSF